MKKIFTSLLAVLTVLTLLCFASLPAFADEETVTNIDEALTAGSGTAIKTITKGFSAVKFSGDNTGFTGTVMLRSSDVKTVIFARPESAFKTSSKLNITLTASETPYSLLRLRANANTLKLIGDGDVIISASNGANVGTLTVNEVVFANSTKQLIIDQNTNLVIGNGTADNPASVAGYIITDANGNTVEPQYDTNGNLVIEVPLNGRYTLKSDAVAEAASATTDASEAAVTEVTDAETTASGTGSAISEGNSTIVICIAAVAVIGIAAFAIVSGKKKKSA